MKVTNTLLLLFLSVNLSMAQEYVGSKKDINQILKNAENFSKYVMDSDYDMIWASYTEDAKIFPNNRKILTGKDSILAYWRLPEGLQIAHHKLMPEEIKIIGQEAYDYGYYEGTTREANGDESSWKGK